MQSGFRQNL